MSDMDRWKHGDPVFWCAYATCQAPNWAPAVHCEQCGRPQPGTPAYELQADTYREHLSERRVERESTSAGGDAPNQPADVDGWPVPGCVSPARERTQMNHHRRHHE